jgi:hypothetical protein
MLNPQSQQDGGGLGFRGATNLLYLLVSGHATCVTPFVRRNFGSEALGRNGAVAMLIIVFYLMAYPRDFLLKDFSLVWFAMIVMQRLKTVWLVRRGAVMHSRGDGYPWLGFLIPLIKRDNTARAVEFAALFALGLWLADFDGGMSRLVVVSSLCLVVKNAFEEEIVRKRLRAMRNAEIEQRDILERYRQGGF